MHMGICVKVTAYTLDLYPIGSYFGYNHVWRIRPLTYLGVSQGREQ